MRTQGVTHEHRSLHFRVRMGEGTPVEYTPDLVARRGSFLFLVEPLAQGAADRARLQLLHRFLESHSPEIVLILVTADADTRGLPSESYDEAYTSAQVDALVRRIRYQDPKGLLLPVRKPEPATSGQDDVRDDRPMV